MTEPEDFLSRWSRRKQGARAEAKVEPRADREDQQKDEQPVAADMRTQRSPQTNDQSDGPKSEPIFDLSKLPSLDSIGPATDIRVFLQPGVPEALSRAALRRAWSTDPGIRDFIELCENSWDFTASDAMHGFGALDPADAKRWLAQLLGDEADKAPHVATAGDEDADVSGVTELTNEEAADAIPEKNSDTGQIESDRSDKVICGTGEAADDNASSARLPDAASQDDAAPQQEPVTLQRRGHGRALPR